MWFKIYAVVFLLLNQAVDLQAGIITEDPPPDCMPFGTLLKSTFVEFAASYFADNPRGTNSSIIPSEIDPLTARNLFSEFYGDAASPRSFVDVFTRILYSDPGNEDLASRPSQEVLLEVDRIVLRDNIYKYAKAGGYDLAREKFGVLLYRGAGEFGEENWLNYRCLKKEAERMVKSATHTELARLRNEIGEFKFGQFLGLGSGTTLAFAIDDTGSMSGEISAAKRRAIEIIEARQGSLDQPQNFVLVPFNDPGVGPLTVTNDPNTFIEAIKKLHAHGGGDAPELSMRGIQLAVENSNPGSSIFVITDVDAKDVELQDAVVAHAKQKNIRITFLLTNRVKSTLCSAYNVPDKCRIPALKSGYELYEHIASSTGGKILVVRKRDIFKATEVIESTLRQGVVQIYRSTLHKGSHIEWVFVDDTLTELFVQSVGQCGKIVVRRPNGSEALQTNKIEIDKLIETRISLNNTYGTYTMELNPNNNCDVTISGRSTKGFVKTLAKRIKNPKTGSIALERFEGQALSTDEVVVLIDEYGKQPGELTESIVIINEHNGVETLFIPKDVSGPNHFVPLYKVPGKSFMVVMRGKDKLGNEFQRISTNDIEIVSLDIDCSPISNMVFRAGDIITVNVTVRNIGSGKMKFTMEATDDKGFVVQEPLKFQKLSRKSPFGGNFTSFFGGNMTGNFSTEETFSGLILASNATTNFPMKVKAKKSSQSGTVSTITITAKPEDGKNLMFKQCRLIVGQNETPDIESFEIFSNINSRFVETSVSSWVHNSATVGRMAEFHVIMPVDAFITEFSMTIDGVNYPGDIEEKEQAKKLFDLARARGLTAGHVASREQSSTTFKTSVNIEAEKRVFFNLKYQQILGRTRGQYRHEIIVQTKQPVGKLSIDVYICENRPLTQVKVLGFDTEQSIHPGPIEMAGATVDQKRTTAHVSINPSREEQLRFSPLGLNGKFVMEYDVERNRGKENEILTLDKYFVHFFSPELLAISKRVVFLLDNSASMYGRKMAQVRSAMTLIIDGLNEEDIFTIVTFNSNVTQWEPVLGSSLSSASNTGKKAAKTFLESVKTMGGTNIELGLNEAIDVLRRFTEENEKVHHTSSDYIVLLTDGRPTEGIVTASDLVNFADKTNNHTYGIHTIGFGSLVDMKTLAKIAARNNGSSIQIFEDIDADLQIFDFFETIARPMLHDIEITYNPEQVASTSMAIFPVLNQGSELVITGELLINDQKHRKRRETFPAQFMDVIIHGKSEEDESYNVTTKIEAEIPSIECLDESSRIENFTQRLNVFMDLQHTLREISAENNQTIVKALKERALNQSLEFGFVTPGITSMVVLKPGDKNELEDTLAEEEAANKEELTMTIAPYRPSPVPTMRGDPFDSSLSGDAHGRGGSGGRSGFWGDPHFIMDLGAQISICYNWIGEEGQMFNLVHDVSSGITVNGRLAVLQMEEKNPRIYVDQLGLILAHQGIKILISCEELWIIKDNGKVVTIPLNEPKNVTLDGVRVLMLNFSDSTDEIFIKVETNIIFRVIMRTAQNSTNILDHLDFSIVNSEGISTSAFGVLGQFLKRNEKAKSESSVDVLGKGKRAIWWYKNKPIKVSLKKLFNYNEGRAVECWFVLNNAEMLDLPMERYYVENMFAIPNVKRPISVLQQLLQAAAPK